MADSRSFFPCSLSFSAFTAMICCNCRRSRNRTARAVGRFGRRLHVSDSERSFHARVKSGPETNFDLVYVFATWWTPQKGWTTMRRAACGSILVLTLGSLPACAPREGDITGDVFIVTRGGGNYKLGLVSVNAYPAEAVQVKVDRRRAEAKKELDTLNPTLRQREASAAAQWEEVERLRKVYRYDESSSGAILHPLAQPGGKEIDAAKERRLTQLKKKAKLSTAK